MTQGLTLMVARLPGATDFRWGASKKLQPVPPWTIASNCSILNFSDCHNRQRMWVAKRENDKFVGQVPKFFLTFGQEAPIS